jgi:hypothetical protein
MEWRRSREDRECSSAGDLPVDSDEFLVDGPQ